MNFQSSIRVGVRYVRNQNQIVKLAIRLYENAVLLNYAQ